MRHTTPRRTLSIGTISSGTLRPEDLIEAFLSELRPLRLSRQDRAAFRKLEREYEAIDPDADPTDDDPDPAEVLSDILGEIEVIAESYVPDYCYLGATEGDGAEIGVWPVTEALEPTSHQGGYDGNIWRSANLPNENAEEMHSFRHLNGAGSPCTFTHWLHVNDHGNATLYRRSGRTWREVWAVV